MSYPLTFPRPLRWLIIVLSLGILDPQWIADDIRAREERLKAVAT